MIFDQIQPQNTWQFAYRARHSCVDLIFTVMMLGQRSVQADQPITIAPSDIPKAFDRVRHRFLIEALQDRGVPRSIIAWFVQIRSLRHSLHFQGLEGITGFITRSIPQGTKWGPLFFALCLEKCLNPVWELCQRTRQGIPLVDIRPCSAHGQKWCESCCTLYVPFVCLFLG